MPTNHTRSPTVEIARLRDAVEQLTLVVSALTAGMDELASQLQWRNNNRPVSERYSPPPFVLTSMPVDPITDDWHINRVKPEDVPEDLLPVELPRQRNLFR